MVFAIEYVQNGKITIKKLLLLTILLLAPAFTVVACTGMPTEAPADDGCGSVMGFGVIAVLGAAFVALKKDKE